jgi:hypothetical protein
VSNAVAVAVTPVGAAGTLTINTDADELAILEPDALLATTVNV